ncbi:MAG: GntR family transcriptional regulator [Paracoccaceae bacterium]
MREGLRTSRVVDAYDRLKEEILQNRMPPGYQAPEPEIAQRLGMSRTPVREALIKLEAMGLVELIPRRGARILPVSLEDMREIYEILAVLEPEAAAQVASSGPSAAAVDGLRRATQEMEAALERGDLEAWAEADDLFHRRLLDMNSNRRLSAFVNTLFDQAHRVRMITLRLRQTPVDSTREHREILNHICDGNPAATRETFRRHRERAADELLGILANYRLPQL